MVGDMIGLGFRLHTSHIRSR